MEHKLAHVIFLMMSTCLLICRTVVLEEQVTSCNTPCDVQQLTCPSRHRLAVREILFSVNTRTNDNTPCRTTHTCGSKTMCCDQPPPSQRDCVFSYSPSHLQAVHRNCSGTRACSVKTERTQEESVACPFFRPDETVSHTITDYVCIEDNAIVDMCTETDTQVIGHTLFALMDASRWSNPQGGAVCRCTAESVKWPTTNTIAVFVVDMRLNTPSQTQCSEADVRLKSGSKTRDLDCESSSDPRKVFPFTALLNQSNVATAELVVHSAIPEFVWIGFESNEAEDIRLSCGLQGYVPIFHGKGSATPVPGGQNAAQQDETNEKAGAMSAGAIAGGVVGAVLLCVAISVVVVLAIMFYRRRQQQRKVDEYSDPHDTVDDIDVYYSTPVLDANRLNTHSATTSSQSNGKTTGGKSTVPEKADDDDGEVYVTAAVVRERKRQSAKKVVRILSIPEISNDVTEYYASPWDIRDRRRLAEGVPQLPPPLHSPTPCSDNDYSMLDRHRRDVTALTQSYESYDRLPAKLVPDAKHTAPGKGTGAGQRPEENSVRDKQSDTQSDTRSDNQTDTCSKNQSDNPSDKISENRSDNQSNRDRSDKQSDNRSEPDGCHHNLAYDHSETTDAEEEGISNS